MFVKKMVTRGIASGVGLASEAMAERKEKKAASSPPNPLSTTTSQEKRYLDSDSSSDSEDADEVQWELDEAAAELGPPPRYDDISNDVAIDPDEQAQMFLQTHHISSKPISKDYQPLPCPVILPQRRPKNKQRGFVRAYAPVLEQSSGIDQKMFIDFLEDLDKASKASPVFDVINLACFAVGLVPNPIAMAVSTAVQVASRTGQEIQSRYRRNTYLDQINETLFKPRGLYCMIMTFKPEAAAVLPMNISSTDQALVKVLSDPSSSSTITQNLAKLKLTSGATTGEVSLPESAPLIYPALETLAAQSPNGEKISSLKQSSAFMASYFDRRAQALYTSSNTSSKLVVPEDQQQFKSKYADPNHPIHAGTLWGLVTGGRYDPVAEKRARKAQRRAGKRGIVLTEEELGQARMGRKLDPARSGRKQKGKGPVGLVLSPVRKAMKKDVLYLTIVKLPSESEIREVREVLERVKSGGRGDGLVQ